MEATRRFEVPILGQGEAYCKVERNHDQPPHEDTIIEMLDLYAQFIIPHPKDHAKFAVFRLEPEFIESVMPALLLQQRRIGKLLDAGFSGQLDETVIKPDPLHHLGFDLVFRQGFEGLRLVPGNSQAGDDQGLWIPQIDLEILEDTFRKIHGTLREMYLQLEPALTPEKPADPRKFIRIQNLQVRRGDPTVAIVADPGPPRDDGAPDQSVRVGDPDQSVKDGDPGPPPDDTAHPP